MCQRSLLFTSLPYDIRAIIYNHLLPDDLPPFTERFDESYYGFALSCRLANQEVLEYALKNLNKFLGDFKVSFEHSTGVEPGVESSLRAITVILPSTAFDDLYSEPNKIKWKRAVLVGLHPLFNKYFDTVRIHIQTEDLARQHLTQESGSIEPIIRARVETGMHSLLHDIAYTFERIQWSRIKDQDARYPVGHLGRDMNPSVDIIFKWERGASFQHKHPNDRVNVERVCISWDMRSNSSSGPLILNGRLHHTVISDDPQGLSQRLLEPITKAALQKAQTYLTDDFYDYYGTGAHDHGFFYQFRDPERLVGEMGIISLTRWKENVMQIYLNRLLNGRFTYEDFFHCEGFGGVIRKGLIGVEEAKFNQEEKAIARLLYDT